MDTTASLLIITMFVMAIALVVYVAVGLRNLTREVGRVHFLLTSPQRYSPPSAVTPGTASGDAGSTTP